MEREGHNLVVISLVVALGLSFYAGGMHAAVTLPPEDKPLIRHFYKKHNICDNVEAYVTHQVKIWWASDKTITAKLLKTLFSDCMVNGCDASILLDGPGSEKSSPRNSGLGSDVFILIDKIKQVLNDRCKGPVVSCSDILTLAVRDAVHLAGAPSYPVFLGRRDGFQSNAAWIDYPSPSINWAQGIAYFQSKGLDIRDFATLLGAHSIGKTHCKNINDRLYNFENTGQPDPTMSKSELNNLRKQCPQTLKSGQKDPTVFLTEQSGSKYRFTNAFYSNVLSHDSTLGIDQQLLYNYNTTQYVLEFAGNFEQFRRSFALSISRMGGLKVLTGKQGEIRSNCRFTNKENPFN